MEYRDLGDSGLRVSALSFGAWQIGDPAYWGDDPAHDADSAVRAALDGGINLFDTAEGYGNGASEEALGRALGTRRDQVLIASKVFPQHCAPDDLRASCEASLRRLGTDRIDLYQVHWPPRQVPFDAVAGTLLELQRAGKIRHIGVSNFGVQDQADWLRAGPAVSNQLGYNLVYRAIEYGILPACRENRLGVLVYMPLMQGLLSGRWETVDEIPPKRRRMRMFAGTREGARHGEPGCEALLMETLAALRAIARDLGVPLARLSMAWLLARPGVSSVIIGARNAAQLQDNLLAAELRLTGTDMARIDAATESLKTALGANPDMWEGAENCRIR
jgi:aryl-alcohol dehydrogenase-like predicted oxidoreductase